MSLPEGWKQLDQYAIRKGGQTICKVTVRGQVRYEAWTGQRRISGHPNLDSAINALRGYAGSDGPTTAETGTNPD